MSSNQLIIPNYIVILSHQHSTTVSLETYPLYSLGSGELLFTLKNAKQMLNFLTKRTVNKLLPDLNNIT